jgi:hypothetical protein
MKQSIIIYITLLIISNCAIAQTNKPTPLEVRQNHIVEMTTYFNSDLLGPKGDSVIIRFDSLGNEVSRSEDLLGDFTTQYSYTANGRPVYRLDFNSSNHQTDSVTYVYKPDGSHTEYRFSFSEYSDGVNGADYYQHYTMFNKFGKEVLRVNANKYSYYFYNKKGDQVGDSAIIPLSATRVSKYTPIYDENDKMIMRTWPSKDPKHDNMETFEYNSLGLLSKYVRTLYGTTKRFSRQEDYFYKQIPVELPVDDR